MENRRWNIKNPHQEDYKKVLCVCSAGLMRSPSAAVVLSGEPFNFNTRSCGLVKEYALIPFDPLFLDWADEVVCMDAGQAREIAKQTKKPVINLDIPDAFSYRDPKLMALIKNNYMRLSSAIRLSSAN